jgi:hypothetical protein
VASVFASSGDADVILDMIRFSASVRGYASECNIDRGPPNLIRFIVRPLLEAGLKLHVEEKLSGRSGRLDRKPSGDLTHWREERKAAIRVGHGLVGNRDAPRFHEPLCLVHVRR